MHLRLASAAAIFVLSAPAFGITALSPTDPSLQGMTIAAGTVPIPSGLFEYGGLGDSTPQLLVDEKVVQNSAGVLDFYYRVRNPPNESYLLKGFSIEFPASNALQLSVDYLDDGNLVPVSASVGNEYQPLMMFAGYSFVPEFNALDGVPLPDAGTDWLVVRTNTSTYVSGTLYAVRWHDDFIGDASGFVPDASSLPEPMTLALLPIGVLGLAVKFRRR